MSKTRIQNHGMRSARRWEVFIIVDSSEEEEEERTEEDKELEMIFKKGQEAKRKILTGYCMSNVSDEVKISTSIYNIKYIYTVCQTCRTNDFFFFVAV